MPKPSRAGTIVLGTIALWVLGSVVFKSFGSSGKDAASGPIQCLDALDAYGTGNVADVVHVKVCSSEWTLDQQAEELDKFLARSMVWNVLAMSEPLAEEVAKSGKPAIWQLTRVGDPDASLAFALRAAQYPRDRTKCDRARLTVLEDDSLESIHGLTQQLAEALTAERALTLDDTTGVVDANAKFSVCTEGSPPVCPWLPLSRCTSDKVATPAVDGAVDAVRTEYFSEPRLGAKGARLVPRAELRAEHGLMRALIRPSFSHRRTIKTQLTMLGLQKGSDCFAIVAPSVADVVKLLPYSAPKTIVVVAMGDVTVKSLEAKARGKRWIVLDGEPDNFSDRVLAAEAVGMCSEWIEAGKEAGDDSSVGFLHAAFLAAHNWDR